MKRIAATTGLLTFLAAIWLLSQQHVVADTMAPTSLVYLGESGVYEIEPDGNFIVKRLGPFRFDFEAGPTYTAVSGERVWSFTGTHNIPPAHFHDWESFGQVQAGCVVEYSGIDDDQDNRINQFFLNDNLIHTINQGMVFSGKFIVPTAGELRVFAGDSAGFWVKICETIATQTPSPSPTVEPTVTITPTPVTPEPTLIFEPVDIYPIKGVKVTSTPSPTVEPTTVPQVTPTEAPPTSTPQVSPTPTKEPRLDACLRFNFEVSGDVAAKGLYIAQEVGGRHLASWYAEDGWQDSGWIRDIDITFPSVYAQVLYYSGPDADPIRMEIVNPAPDSTDGWLSRGMCHALEIGWPE